MPTATPWLSLSIWVPILAGLVVMATGRDDNARIARAIALLGAVVGFLVTIPLYTGFDVTTSAMQFMEKTPWIERFNMNYHLGVDGISVLFVLLNSFITVLVVIAGWEVIQSRVSQYMAAFLIMSGLLNGVFAALDGALFYVFFEATLIPMYLIIGVWGGPNRVYAALKFFLFTLLGSLLLLVAFIYLYNASGGSFAILDWHAVPIPRGDRWWNDPQILLFLGLFAAFSVKVPMWPVHTWLPDAHVEAPTGGSAVLAAILLKLGAYGFVRFSLPILPDASHALAGFMIALSLIAVLYIALVALVQPDMKKLIAYSSISHMGFVTLGFFIFNAYGAEGALVQMISHGFVSAALFLCVGVMYDRMHSRMITDYGGVVNTMPKFAAFMMLFAMANCGLPATSGFVGEFLVIMGAMKFNFWIAFIAATTLVFGAAYTLWMYKRVIYGAIANPHVAGLEDLNGREFLVLGSLAVAVLAMGIYPAPFTEVMHASVNDLLKHVAAGEAMTEYTLPLLLPAYPEIWLLVMASTILVVDLFLPEDSRRSAVYWLSLATLAGCVLLTILAAQATGGQPAYTFGDMFIADLMAHTLKLLSYLAVAACFVYSRRYLADRDMLRGEYFVFALFALLGMMVMISANHLLVLYLGLELMSLCLYSMVALNRDSAISTEAAMKYFVLGALASGLLLYGMSMLYGATGTLNIEQIAQVIAAGKAKQVVLVFGLVFVVAGLAFKLGVVPFHMWIPDVYHGAPNAMTLFIGSAPELAAFAMAIRLLVNGLVDLAVDWQVMLMIMSVASMALGNLAAIAQSNIKRMLAYSAISHMGFMLLGLLAGVVGGNLLSAPNAYSAAMFYTIVYVLMSLGAFGIVLALSRAGFEAEEITDFRGLNQRAPWYAFLMLLLMFSLAGIPPLAGFYAKLIVLDAVIKAGQIWLAVFAVLMSLIGAFYYIRVVKVMYFEEPESDVPIENGLDMRMLLSANGLAVLVLGVMPGPLMSLCLAAIQGIYPLGR